MSAFLEIIIEMNELGHEQGGKNKNLMIKWHFNIHFYFMWW